MYTEFTVPYNHKIVEPYKLNIQIPYYTKGLLHIKVVMKVALRNESCNHRLL